MRISDYRQSFKNYQYYKDYDFSKFIYIDFRTNGLILDRFGNEFLISIQRLNRLKECLSFSQAKNKLDYIKFLCKEQYGNKYNYDLIEPTFKKPVKIICNKHGQFLKRLDHHLYHNSGCSICCKEIEFNEIVKKANIIHSNKYTYRINEKSGKIFTICPIHGEFEQLINNHLYKKCGCKDCRVFTTEEFIKRAKLIHGEHYDYSKTVYKNADSKLIITCKEHGDVEIRAHNHISKQANGCKFCAIENNEGSYSGLYRKSPDLKIFLYHFKFIREDGFTFYKIGLSVNPKERIRKMNLSYKEILEVKEGNLKDLYLLEQEYHKLFKEFRIDYYPEELIGNGATECYKW